MNVYLETSEWFFHFYFSVSFIFQYKLFIYFLSHILFMEIHVLRNLFLKYMIFLSLLNLSYKSWTFQKTAPKCLPYKRSYKRTRNMSNMVCWPGGASFPGCWISVSVFIIYLSTCTNQKALWAGAGHHRSATRKQLPSLPPGQVWAPNVSLSVCHHMSPCIQQVHCIRPPLSLSHRITLIHLD